MLFLDADTRLKADFLEKAVEELNIRRVQVGGVYMRSPGSSWAVMLGLLVFNTGLCLGQHLFPMATGACLFSTRAAHDAIGGFDESIVLCEDCDYVKRAWKTGGIQWRHCVSINDLLTK